MDNLSHKLIVDLAERSYPIFIGRGILQQAKFCHQYISAKQVMIVSNATVAELYLAPTKELFNGFEVSEVILPDGEEYKNLTILNLIFDQLLTQHHDRRTTLVALGGGVIGDMTGFAAACYQRGVNFIQIPTTLLAQVDSSVGGKTGVNHAQGKNMIGAFHQPRCVLIDTDTLSTLDARQFAAGLAEVVKYGLIDDREFFNWLETNAENLLALDAGALAYAVHRCCANKARIVAQDETETGIRALLNLGHTFGHAIETGLGYGKILHGEAVAIGMLLAADMSNRLGWISSFELQKIRNLLKLFNLPTSIPHELSPDEMLNLMQVDKKVQAGKLRLVLMRGFANSAVIDNYPLETLHATLANGYQSG
jgi:3-dehydroquinate synthase